MELADLPSEVAKKARLAFRTVRELVSATCEGCAEEMRESGMFIDIELNDWRRMKKEEEMSDDT